MVTEEKFIRRLSEMALFPPKDRKYDHKTAFASAPRHPFFLTFRLFPANFRGPRWDWLDPSRISPLAFYTSRGRHYLFFPSPLTRKMADGQGLLGSNFFISIPLCLNANRAQLQGRPFFIRSEAPVSHCYYQSRGLLKNSTSLNPPKKLNNLTHLKLLLRNITKHLSQQKRAST